MVQESEDNERSALECDKRTRIGTVISVVRSEK